uniref:CSON000488 protein n=1 Tax=Culicoides sonorensis TaxID=179676 RepID=A0A336MFT4_CULSO
MDPGDQTNSWSEEEMSKAKIDLLLSGKLAYIWIDANNNKAPPPPTIETPKKVSFKPKKSTKPVANFCAFCKNNGVARKLVNSHNTKNCPRLQSYRCPTCGGTGHTIRYCPKKEIITPEDLIGKA